MADPDRSFDGFIRKHLAYVWRVCRALGGESAADDHAQEVFLVARRRFAQFDGRHPKAWLFTIARNVVRNHRRRERTASERLRLVPQRPGPDTPEDRMVIDEAAALMERFLETLSAKKRVAFFLCDIEGLTAKEAAAALRIPTRTVYSRVRSARAELEVFAQKIRGEPSEVRR